MSWATSVLTPINPYVSPESCLVKRLLFCHQPFFYDEPSKIYADIFLLWCLMYMPSVVTHLIVFLLMYYYSEKECTFVIVTKSTCLKIHVLAPPCLWSVQHLLFHRGIHCSLLVKQGSVLALVLHPLRTLYGSEHVMEQTWLLCNWLSCMARLPGPWLATLQLAGLWLC